MSAFLFLSQSSKPYPYPRSRCGGNTGQWVRQQFEDELSSPSGYIPDRDHDPLRSLAPHPGIFDSNQNVVKNPYLVLLIEARSVPVLARGLIDHAGVHCRDCK